MSAFFVGYIFLQIPAGMISNRVGARAALTVMMLGCALAAAASARAHSYAVLYGSRLALGVAQSGLFAVMIMTLRDWFPTERRGAASAAITACMSVGAVVANGLTVRLLPSLGWRWTFLAYALFAVVWAVGFFVWFRNTPEEHSSVNPAERDLIRGAKPSDFEPKDWVVGPSKEASSTVAALVMMAGSPAMWALCVQAFFQAFGYAFYITWFPAWLEKGKGVKLTDAGDLTMLPLIGSFAGSLLAGYAIDAILVRTGNRWLSRCGVAALALTLCAGATVAATRARSPSSAVAVIALGMFFSGFAKPVQWAATMDLSGQYSAVGFAVMNVAGNIGAIVCPLVLGRMLNRLSASGGDWNSVLYLIAGIHLAGALAWLVLNPSRSAVGSST